MIRLSSPTAALVLLPAFALALAAPASATSIVSGEKLCKAAAQQASPAPKSIRVDKNNTRATNARFDMELRVRTAEGEAEVWACVVDRVVGAATITPPAAE